MKWLFIVAMLLLGGCSEPDNHIEVLTPLEDIVLANQTYPVKAFFDNPSFEDRLSFAGSIEYSFPETCFSFNRSELTTEMQLMPGEQPYAHIQNLVPNGKCRHMTVEITYRDISGDIMGTEFLSLYTGDWHDNN